ncbi:hypothetical protein D3C73_1486910 [compost metagenome]
MVTTVEYMPIKTMKSSSELTIKSDALLRRRTFLIAKRREVSISMPSSVATPKNPPIYTAPMW